MQRMLAESVTLPAIKALIGCKENYKAVRMLIGRSKAKERVTNVTIQLLLEGWRAQAGKWKLFKNYDPLTFAIELLSRATARPLADNVVRAAAEAGFNGRFPELTHRVLGRDPSTVEVGLLVTAYVSDKGARAKDIEEKLIAMAIKFLGFANAEKERERIYAFQKEWEATD